MIKKKFLVPLARNLACIAPIGPVAAYPVRLADSESLLGRLRAIRWNQEDLVECIPLSAICPFDVAFAHRISILCAARKDCPVPATDAPPAVTLNGSHGESALKPLLKKLRHACAPVAISINHVFQPPTSQGLVAFTFSLS
jgi:hypothetical protein